MLPSLRKWTPLAPTTTGLSVSPFTGLRAPNIVELSRVVEDSQDFNLPHASPQALGGTGLYWDWTLDWTLELDMHGLWMRLVCSR